jgi:Domain of unknown function (DUF427)
MRIRFGGIWIADSENVLLLVEPGRYPVAYFPTADVSPGGQTVIPHGPDRELIVAEALPRNEP